MTFTLKQNSMPIGEKCQDKGEGFWSQDIKAAKMTFFFTNALIQPHIINKNSKIQG